MFYLAPGAATLPRLSVTDSADLSYALLFFVLLKAIARRSECLIIVSKKTYFNIKVEMGGRRVTR